MIIDTHCHLNSPQLYSKRDELIKKAQAVGVCKFIVVGYDLKSSQLAVKISEEYPGVVFAAVGIHPSDAIKAGKNDLAEIEELIQHQNVIGVGEIGLDYYWMDSPKELQEEFFIKQLELADKYKKPFIIHMRDATEDTLKILTKHKHLVNNSGIMHCYSGSAEIVDAFLKLGLYISFGGPLTFKNARVPKEAILKVPFEKLLFETDCPYLAPHPLRGKENEPANVMLVGEEASKILNIPYEELIKIEHQNVLRLFKI